MSAAAVEIVLVEGTCRLATFRDRKPFVRLWRAFLEQQRKIGSGMWADDHNLRLYREIFDRYVKGQEDGVVVFWTPTEGTQKPSALVMAGDAAQGHPWHTDVDQLGRLATLWGVYVDPPYRGHRVGLQVEQLGRLHLLKMGFTHAATSVLANNPLGEGNWRHWDEAHGVKAVETLILADLQPEEVR